MGYESHLKKRETVSYVVVWAGLTMPTFVFSIKRNVGDTECLNRVIEAGNENCEMISVARYKICGNELL